MATRSQIEAGRAVIVVDIKNAMEAGLKKIEKRIRQFASSVGQIGFDLFRGGLAGSIPVFGSLNEFMKFEDEILRLGTKLQATDKQLKSVEATIRQLGKTTSFTTLEVAQGATSLAQAGLNPAEVQQGLQAVLDLGRGAKITLDESADLLANTAKTFKIPVSSFGNIASQFVAAARLSTIEVSNLKESIKEVSGTLNDLNVDLPTSLALINQLGFRSLKGTKAGTTLNTMLLNFVARSKQLAKTLKVDLINKQTGAVRNIVDVLNDFGKATEKLNPADRARLSQFLFNIRGARGETALREIDAIVKMAKEIRNAGNEARAAAIKMDSGLGGSVRRATSAINDLAISLGQKLAPNVQYVLDLVPALSASIDQIVQQFPQMTVALLAIPPGILAVGAAMLAMSFTLGKVASLVGVLATLSSSVAGYFQSMAGDVGKGLDIVGTKIANKLREIDNAIAVSVFGTGRGRRKRPKSILTAQLTGPQIGKKQLARIGAGLSSLGGNALKGLSASATAISSGLSKISKVSGQVARRLLLSATIISQVLKLLFTTRQFIDEIEFSKITSRITVLAVRLAKLQKAFAIDLGIASVASSINKATFGVQLFVVRLTRLIGVYKEANKVVRDAKAALRSAQLSSVISPQSLVAIVKYRKGLAESNAALKKQALRAKAAKAAANYTKATQDLVAFNKAQAQFQASQSTLLAKYRQQANATANALEQQAIRAKAARAAANYTRATQELTALRKAQQELNVANQRYAAALKRVNGVNVKARDARYIAQLGKARKAAQDAVKAFGSEQKIVQRQAVARRLALSLTKKANNFKPKKVDLTVLKESLKVERQRAATQAAATRQGIIQRQLQARQLALRLNKAADAVKPVAVDIAAEKQQLKVFKKISVERANVRTAEIARITKTNLATKRFFAQTTSQVLSAGGSVLRGIGGSFKSVFSGAKGGIFKAGASLGRFLLSGINYALKGGWISTITKTLTSVGSVVKAFFAAGVGFGKFLFSFNGLFQLTLLLVTFGENMRFTKGILGAFGRAFGALGKSFTDIANQGQYAFKQISSGIKLIFAGQGGLGVGQIAEGLKNLSSIITNNLLAGMNRFIEAIGPGLDYIYALFAGIWELLKQVGRTIGLLLSPLQEIGKTGGNNSFISDFLDTVFSPKTIIEGVRLLGSIVEGIGTGLSMVLEKMFSGLSNLLLFISSAIEDFLKVIEEFASRTVYALPTEKNKFALKQMQVARDSIRANGMILAVDLENVSEQMREVPFTLAESTMKMNAALDQLAKDTDGQIAARAAARALKREQAAQEVASEAFMSTLYNEVIRGLTTLGDSTLKLSRLQDDVIYGFYGLAAELRDFGATALGKDLNREISMWENMFNNLFAGPETLSPFKKQTLLTDLQQRAAVALKDAGDKAAAAIQNPKQAIGQAVAGIGGLFQNPAQALLDAGKGVLANGAAGLAAEVGKAASEIPENIKGLYGAVVGSFQETRGRLMSGKSETEKQTDVLKNISSGLHRGNTPYLQSIDDKISEPEFT